MYNPDQNIRLIPVERHSAVPDSAPHHCQGHQEQGNSGKLFLRGSQGDVTTKCNVPLTGSWNRKRTLSKKDI